MSLAARRACDRDAAPVPQEGPGWRRLTRRRRLTPVRDPAITPTPTLTLTLTLTLTPTLALTLTLNLTLTLTLTPTLTLTLTLTLRPTLRPPLSLTARPHQVRASRGERGGGRQG
jgi:hypothetical protein